MVSESEEADLWNVDLRFPQLLAPLPAPVASLHTPPHFQPPFFLSHTHRNRNMNTNMQACRRPSSALP